MDALSVPCKLMYSEIVNIMQYEYILVVSVFYIVHTTNSFFILYYVILYSLDVRTDVTTATTAHYTKLTV